MNQTNFDTIGSGSESGLITEAARIVYFQFGGPAQARDYLLDLTANTNRIRIFGSVSFTDETDIATVSISTGATFKSGPMRVDQSGDWLYLDRNLGDFSVAEYYVRFDDGQTIFPITPGTVLVKSFKRYEVVGVQVESIGNVMTLATVNGSLNQEYGIQVRFFAGFGLAVHGRPDLRVKIADVSTSVNFNGRVIGGVPSAISAIEASAAAVMLGEFQELDSNGASVYRFPQLTGGGKSYGNGDPLADSIAMFQVSFPDAFTLNNPSPYLGRCKGSVFRTFAAAPTGPYSVLIVAAPPSDPPVANDTATTVRELLSPTVDGTLGGSGGNLLFIAGEAELTPAIVNEKWFDFDFVFPLRWELYLVIQGAADTAALETEGINCAFTVGPLGLPSP